MLAVKDWAKDKPYLIALIAPQITPIVIDLHLDFKQIKSRRFGNNKFHLKHLTPWFALYRSHRKGIAHLKAVYAAIFGHEFVGIMDILVKGLRNLKNADKETLAENLPTPQEFEEIRQMLLELLDASFIDLEKEFSNEPVDHDSAAAMKQLIADKPLDSSFFLFVEVPCWLLYRVSPTTLYRKARGGDFDALERLLRLDPLMLHDPYVGMKIAKFRFNNKMPQYRKLLAAPFKNPKGGIQRKNLILSIVGLISALSHIIQKPLTANDIFKLVAAIDEDAKCNLLDDLPKDPDALARALQPHRNQWRKILQPDKKM
jgi:hypothetical protein